MIPSSSITKREVLLAVLTASAFVGSTATVSQCMVATDILATENSSKLRSANDVMWEEFNQECEDSNGCPLTMDEIFLTSRLNFDALAHTPQYRELKNACERIGADDKPTTLCKADSELLVYNGQDGENGQAVDDFYISNEPVCFPFECGQKQIDLFHTSPLGCDPTLQSCVVYHMDPGKCGKRAEGAGSGNCVKHSKDLQKNKEYVAKLNELHAMAGMNCIQSKMNDGVNEICQVESKPVKITMGKNFRIFEDKKSYQDFFDACSEANGLTCHVSAMVSLKGNAGFLNMDLTGDYNDYPVCLANTCSREEMEIVSTKQIGDGIIHEVNKIVESHAKRKLLPQLKVDDDFNFRRLEATGDEQCPFAKLDTCEFTVTDFYCAGISDVMHGNTMMQSSSSFKSSSLAANGSFMAAMAVAGGMLM